MRISILLLLAIALGACGPREIGEGSSYEPPLSGKAQGADIMRLPMTGMSNTQKMLYWQNRPDVMDSMRKWNVSKMRKNMGLEPSPEDPAYREKPKQRSPFRQ